MGLGRTELKKKSRSFGAAFFVVLARLSCGFDGSCFADDADLDAAGVGEFLFDAAGDIAADDGGFFVVDDAGFDEDADFAAGLDGVALFDAFE